MLDRGGVGPRFRAQIPLYLKEGILILAAATSSVAGYMTAAQAALVAQLTTSVAYAAPTLSTNWSDLGGGFAASGYMKDATGRVYLRGTIKKSVAVTPAETLFTLPSGFRPSASRGWAVPSNSAFGYVTITSAGVVAVQVGNAAFLCLDGISFDTA